VGIGSLKNPAKRNVKADLVVTVHEDETYFENQTTKLHGIPAMTYAHCCGPFNHPLEVSENQFCFLSIVRVDSQG
jgi:hypothetical protein